MANGKVGTMATPRAGHTTHVLEYDGGLFTREISARRDIKVFSDTLSRFNGTKPWALTLIPLPAGMDYEQVLKAKIETTEYVQAGGSADAMTVQIRKPGGNGSDQGVESVWYVVGHPGGGGSALDVAIPLPNSVEMISRTEVFGAAEAAELFFAYYQHGDIPSGYALRSINGWTAGGIRVDLRERASQ